MKKKYLLIPSLALLMAMPFAVDKTPVMAFAEGEETSEVEPVAEEQEEPVAEEETDPSIDKKTFDIESIVIDGKTIGEWKKELMDEQTRSTAIMGLALAGAVALLGFIKWLLDHKLLTSNKTQIASLISENQQVKQLTSKLEGVVAEYKARDEKLMKAVKEAHGDAIRIEQILNIVMTHDPTLVSSGAFRKAKALLEGRDAESEEN